ncbi:site-specific DNA-methyltransferase [Helicobacter pylori]|nr:site-specific DNA-methyltransferase [Helicobacter pylori]WQY12590.1 site-specific DNA-methyltransferase [Helicobacter pylori]
MQNLLIQAENAIALLFLLNDKNLKGKIDLIYIDPPFATNNHFTITNGRATTISNSKNGDIAYSDKVVGMDFIEFLKQRLVLLKELLSEQGSIYVHTDCKIGHYVKVMLDEIFGIQNFRNEITRIKCNPKNFKRMGYGNIKDMILRTDIATLERWDKEGLIEYSNNNNPRKKIYALEQVGKRVQDIWEFKDPQYPSYPTEKNAQLLDLIIKTSSNKDSIVLDCFCGSGTTLKSAFLLQRKFIGIDNSNLAIQACKNKLETITKDLFVSQNFYDFLVF